MITRSGGQVGELEVKARTGSMKLRCSSRARPASTVKANRHIQPILKVIGTIQVDQNPSKAIKATPPQRQPSSNTSIFHQHLSSLVSYTLRRSPPPYPKTPHHLPNLENTLGLVAEVVISYSWVWRSLRQMVCRNEVESGENKRTRGEPGASPGRTLRCNLQRNDPRPGFEGLSN
jgi:hypothetical protein